MRRAAVDSSWLEELDHRQGALPLSEPTAHYFRDVLRLGPEAFVELFDGTGRYARGRLSQLPNGELGFVASETGTRARGQSPCAIVLYQAIPKGDRWSWVLEKATELGVHRIVPLRTARSVVDVGPDKSRNKIERWQKIVAEAARQSERDIVPLVEDQRDLATALSDSGPLLRFVLHVDETTRSLTAHLADARKDTVPDRIGLFIGPEGGFTASELDLFRGAGVIPCSLGPRILRAETAGITAVAITQSIIGDLA
jgi:16S rRNA (uracil1498-N3)-methyltransferase